ncbi:PAS domain S-box-containing protein [Nonomuraea maritima]|uniref:PAS domain S-box-containing protein n=1 Tax=Nonomuraea maritima TaxID=683260 RepID=A0A1G9NA26_9ACTN|nr:SpoIIE family protein phosphatase [Nonomuraea maritima]SDL83356.1 PAS domain S-box-containing protein [Nonomuraea maritima]
MEHATDLSGLPLHAFNIAPAGVAMTSGPEHRLVYINDAYRAIYGDRQLGIPFHQAFHDLVHRNYFSDLDYVYETGESLALKEMPYALTDGGPERYATITLTRIPLQDDVKGVLMTVVEVTDQVVAAPEAEPAAESRRRFLQRFQGLLQVDGEQVVWVTDADGMVTEPIPALQRVTGQAWTEQRGEGWQDTIHPDDRDEVVEMWSEARRTMTSFEYVFRMRMADGTHRHVRVRGAPVFQRGDLVEWVGSCVDVEQEWQRERREKLLQEAAAVTANMAGLDEVLTLLANVIVPAVLDGCGIYLVPEYDEPLPDPLVAERFVSIVRDPLRPAPEPGRVAVKGRCAFAEAVRTRKTVYRTFPPGCPPPDLAPRGAEEWFRASGANSVALVPVVVDGVVAAVLDAVICGDREPINDADIELLNGLIEHAHTHLSNALRYQRTQRISLALQHYLLPDPPKLSGLDIVARYRPSTTVAEIGGDWYDCFQLPDGSVVVAIGDVAGHDLGAATTMSQIRNMLRGLAMDRNEPPGDILHRLNVATEALYGEVTATCVLARLEASESGGWRLTYSVAGHPPPLLVTRDGEAHYLDGSNDPLLGVVCERPRTSVVTHLPAGGTLLLYTDGLVKHPHENLEGDLATLQRNAASLARKPLDILCDQLLARMSTQTTDDIAMIALRPPVR